MRTVLTILGLAITMLCSGQTRSKTEYHFGFNLMPSHGGKYVSFAIVHVRDGKVIGSTPIDKGTWIRMVSGERYSTANPDLKNLFIEYQIDSCWVLYDANYHKYGKKKYVGYDCVILDNLWKMRYKDHPSIYGELGWSRGGYSPNGSQRAFLMRFYNVLNMSEFFYGESMWQLFKDMTDPDWVSFYTDGDLTWTPIPLPKKEEETPVSDSTSVVTPENE